MKNKIIFGAILIIFSVCQLCWADNDPWTRENEQFAHKYIEKLRHDKPGLFRNGSLLSKKFVNAQFADEYGDGWLQYNFEYHFSSGWCIAKVFLFKQQREDKSVRYKIFHTSKSVNDYNFEFSGNEKIITEDSHKYFVKTYEDGEVRRASISNEANTKIGKLRVISKEYNNKAGFGMRSALVLNYKEIFNSETSHINLYGVFNIDGQLHILMGENCGGSGCRFDDLSLLILDKHKEVEVIKTEDFYSEDNSIKADLKANAVIINLGLYKGQKKTAVYQNGELKILYKKLSYKPLTDRQCADLYRIMKGCIRPIYLKDFSCDQHAVNFSGIANSDTWELRYISNEPGFDKRLFDEECLNACKTENLSEYNKFSKRMCGSK